ncbi:MAG: pyridoxal 5'-phosphate synthase glutaminase subunit PdxT [bacterium]|nr:pyridoxal 5'-phosphate synthase glutaminase subunit PdxT [bacterium]
MKIGILAIQGDFELHARKIVETGNDYLLVKKTSQLDEIDGIILPGGESTTISKIISRYALDEILRERVENGFPVFATCAGLIMLAKKLEGKESEVTPLGVLNITVKRNAYGRQRESFEAPLKINLDGKEVGVTGVFIRAPKIVDMGKEVQVLGRFEDSPVIVRQGNILAMTFHPELAEGTEIYEYFLNIIIGRR